MTKLTNIFAGFAALSSSLFLDAGASAALFVFDGINPGPTAVDAPVSATTPCGSPGFDFCDVDNAGFDYSRDGVSFNAQGLVDGSPSVIIQDIRGLNQGLGVMSEGRFLLDQINADANESILFTFMEQVVLSNVELNNGTGEDCPFIGTEGGCGLLDIVIDRGLMSETVLSDIIAIEFLAGGFVGTTFEFIATTANEGFSIASFEVNVPLPPALPLFLAGLACFGAVSRKKVIL